MNIKLIRDFFLFSTVAVVLLFLPAGAQGCPTCFASASKKVLHSYYVSVAFLSLLPFGLVALISTWLRTQRRRPNGLGFADEAPEDND